MLKYMMRRHAIRWLHTLSLRLDYAITIYLRYGDITH